MFSLLHVSVNFIAEIACVIFEHKPYTVRHEMTIAFPRAFYTCDHKKLFFRVEIGSRT